MLIHSKFNYILLLIIYLFGFYSPVYSQCSGFIADAGSDFIICDSGQVIQFQGSVQGNYTKIYWTPSFGLNDPGILDPMVSLKNPGKYIYTLHAEGHSSNNLIINGDFESGNSGFTSNYTNFNLPGWIPTGAYAVDVNPAPYYVPEYEACVDHTTGSGNMMINNGSMVSGLDVWCQTISVKPNTDYYFEAFFASIYPTAPAGIRISFNGIPLQTVQLPNATCEWIPYQTNWNSGANTSLTICMQDMNLIGWGNDFAIDDIGLFEKCVDTDEVLVDVVNLKAKLEITFRPKCSVDPFDLNGSGSSTGPNIRYQWSSDIGKIVSQSGLTAKGKGNGIYTLKVIYTNGNLVCEKESSVEYITPGGLSGNIISSGKINCTSDSVTLKTQIGSGSGQYTYQWAADTSILNGNIIDSIRINKAQKYAVTITDQISGCILKLNYDVPADTTKPVVKIFGDTAMDCRKSSVFLLSNLTDSNRYFFTWVVPDQSIIRKQSYIINSQPGKYKLVIEDRINHCADSSYRDIVVDTLRPELDLGTTQDINCLNNFVSVTNKSLNIPDSLSYFWTIDNQSLVKETSLLNKTITKSSIIHLLIINEKNGCSQSDSVIVTDSRSIPLLNAGTAALLTCKENSVQLQATINPLDTLSILWNTISGNILSGNTTTRPLVNARGWYYIQIKNQNNNCENRDSVFVDENKQRPNAQAGPDQIFSCQDSTKTIDASNSSSGPDIIYIWSSQNGSIITGFGSNKIKVSSPGTYQLIVVDTLNGCSDTSDINILPDLNKPIVSIINPDTINCKNNSIRLFGQVLFPSGSGTVLWTGPNGATISSPDSLSTIVNKSGNYFFTATDNLNSCKTIVQTIVYSDTMKPSFDLGPAEIIWNCASKKIKLEPNVSGSSNLFNYFWSMNGNIIGQDKFIIVDSPGVYVLEVTDQTNGCGPSKDTVNIISDVLKPILVIQKPDTINCFHNTIPLNAQRSSSGMRYQIQWYSLNGHITSKTDTNSIQVNKSGWYYLFITDTINKCNQLDSVFVVEDTRLPMIHFQIPPELTCSRKTITLEATINNTGSNTILNWNTANGNISSAKNLLQCTADKAGRYFFKVQNLDNGCENLDSVDIFENQNIPVDFNYKIEQAKCIGDKASIDLMDITGGVAPYSYYIDDQLINHLPFQNLSPGWKNIKIIDVNGCEYSKDIFINQPAAIGVSLPAFIKINKGATYQIKPNFSIPLDSIDWINWSPFENLSCTDCPEPLVINLNEERTYTIHFSNKQGCIASAAILIQILKNEIWVPTAFSPNNDNINDWFYPVVSEGSSDRIRSMSVFNRWGDRIFLNENFQANKPSEGWNGESNGEKANPGVYVYIIEMEWNNGETQFFKGDITLMR